MLMCGEHHNILLPRRLLASILLHRSPIPCRPCCGEGVKHVAPATTQLSTSLRKLSRQLRSVKGSPWAPMTIPVVSKKMPKSLSLLTGKARHPFYSHLSGSRAGSRIMVEFGKGAYKGCDISDVTTSRRRLLFFARAEEQIQSKQVPLFFLLL